MVKAQPIKGTQEEKSCLAKVLAGLKAHRVLRIMLEYCAEETMGDRASALTQETIAKKLWPGDEFRAEENSDVRSSATRLRIALNEYYRTEGKDDRIRFNMPEKDYYITAVQQRVFPQPKIGTPQHEVSPTKFKNFLVAMCEPEGITPTERNRLVQGWKDGNRFANMTLKPRNEFDDFFRQISNNKPRLSLAEMRGLTTYMGIHPLMLDPLLSEPYTGDGLELSLSDFILPEVPPDESHGLNAHYAVPPKRFSDTDASFIFLKLDGDGRSDVHHHPGDELMFVVEGEIEVRLHDSGLRVGLKQGEVSHFHAEQTHSAVNVSKDKPAYIFIIRFYQMLATPSPRMPRTRQQMRENLRRVLGGMKGELTASAKGWVLQALANRSVDDLKEQTHTVIRDRLGLARMIRILPNPQRRAESEFLNRIGIALNKKYRKLDDLLNDLEIGELMVSDEVLRDLSGLYRDVYDLLFLRFLFPGVPGAMVFRPDDREDGIDVAQLKLKNLVAIPEGVAYTLPRRSLSCSDIAISLLALKPEKGTRWNQHPGYELLLPLEGEAEIQLGHDRKRPPYRISADEGRLAHYHSEKLHRVSNPASDMAARILVIRFYGEGQSKSAARKRR
jgi:quercetin dioxygenase-like cupin family protein